MPQPSPAQPSSVQPGLGLTQCMLQVRRRKGLAVDKKVVESATKQRTRARKV